MTGEQHATSAAITISPGQTGNAGSDWWILAILTPHWSSGTEEVPSLETVGSRDTVMREAAHVLMRDLSVVSPPIPDIVTRSVTGPGETSLLGVIRSASDLSIMTLMTKCIPSQARHEC